MPTESLIYYITQFYESGRLDGMKFSVCVGSSSYLVTSVCDLGFSVLAVDYKSMRTGLKFRTLLNQFSSFFLQSLYDAIQTVSIDHNLF